MHRKNDKTLKAHEIFVKYVFSHFYSGRFLTWRRLVNHFKVFFFHKRTYEEWMTHMKTRQYAEHEEMG